MKTLQDKIKLGNLASPGDNKDAFHVAGIVLSCPFEVSPGDSLKYVSPEKEEGTEDDYWGDDNAPRNNDILVLCKRNDPKRQFIVDPFLLAPVPKYTLFWALPVLSSVVNLTHTFQILGREQVVVELPLGMTEDSISCALQNC